MRVEEFRSACNDDSRHLDWLAAHLSQPFASAYILRLRGNKACEWLSHSGPQIWLRCTLDFSLLSEAISGIYSISKLLLAMYDHDGEWNGRFSGSAVILADLAATPKIAKPVYNSLVACDKSIWTPRCCFNSQLSQPSFDLISKLRFISLVINNLHTLQDFLIFS